MCRIRTGVAVSRVQSASQIVSDVSRADVFVSHADFVPWIAFLQFMPTSLYTEQYKKKSQSFNFWQARYIGSRNAQRPVAFRCHSTAV